MSTCTPLSIGTLITCLAMMATSFGCGSLQTGPASPGADEVAAAPNGELFVELHDADQQVYHLKAPFKDSMFVQDALRESGAMRRYRRMDLTLVRQLPNGQKLRVPVKYDAVKKAVTPATNYSLHPNDTLEVVQDASTTFDRMLESAMAPLRPIMR